MNNVYYLNNNAGCDECLVRMHRNDAVINVHGTFCENCWDEVVETLSDEDRNEL